MPRLPSRLFSIQLSKELSGLCAIFVTAQKKNEVVGVGPYMLTGWNKTENQAVLACAGGCWIHDSVLAECQLQRKKKRHIRLWAQVCTGVLISSIFSILLDSLPRGKLACMWGIGMHWYVLDYAVCLFFWKKTIVWSIQWSKKWGSGTSLCKQVSAMWAWSRQRTSISCSGRWMFLTKSTKTQIVKLFYNYLQCTILQTKDLSDRSRILPKKLVDPVFLSPRPLRHWRHLKTRPELTLWSISANVSQLSPPRKFWESWPAMECVKLKCFILRNSILSWFYPRTKLCIHSCA